MIAVDWGTTRVRAWRMDSAGRIRERRALDAGAMTVARDEFAAVLESLVGPWCAQGEGPLLLCGMVGSRHGWIEVPYVPCPASLADIAAGMVELPWAYGRVFIVPGLAYRDVDGVPDLLRGEESQALGAMAVLPEEGAALCLPGTHSKHLRVRNGRIVAFSTYMTGELFSLLLEHGILGRLADGRSIDDDAFAAGVQCMRGGASLSHRLFSVRACALTGELLPGAVAGYLSGLLIGHELSQLQAERIFIAAEPLLAKLYARAISIMGGAAQVLNADVAAAGLHRLALSLGERAFA